ncbi:MAG TPA: M56 family metallopeptidase [Euzebyales bacterium]
MPDGAGGFFLFLFESFAARALLGSLVAVLLVEVLLRRDVVRSVIGRRLLLVMPFVAAAVLAVVSADNGFLPNVWIDTDRLVGAGALMDVLGDVQRIGGSVDLLVAGYLLVVGLMITRRLAGVVRVHALRRRSPLAPPRIRRRALTLAVQAGITPPQIRLRARCPGGAFTAGIRRPWIAVDPDLLATLDEAELDALLAHEMAHIRRRDPLLTLLTGLSRDVTFFLPGLHLATCWLRREQEEAADDLAARCTRRPGALASTILKVWESQTAGRRVVGACAAVSSTVQWPGLGLGRTTQPHVVVRVQRLISPPHGLSHRPRRRDVGLSVTVLTVAVMIGLLLPAWTARLLHNDGVLLQVLPSPSSATTESPAFATFRATAPVAGVTQRSRSAASAVADVTDDGLLCPCIESTAQLRAGTHATAGAAPSHLVWAGDGQRAWELQKLHDRARLRVDDELITFRGGMREVGFFTVSRNATER